MKDFKAKFKELARNKQASAADHIEYFILKAMSAKSNNNKAQIASDMIKEAFRPVSNTNKLTNGMHPFLGLIKAMHEAAINPFPKGTTYDTKDWSTRPVLSCFENVLEVNRYQDIWNEIYNSINSKGQELLDKDYMFFFVRDDIPVAYQAVQAAHAALVMGGKDVFGIGGMGKYDPSEINFVVCSVAPEEFVLGGELRNIIFDKLVNVSLVEFKEPDLNNEVTCICTTPIPYSHKGVFSHYKLMKFPIQKGHDWDEKYFPDEPDSGRNGVYIPTPENEPTGFLTLV